VGVSYSNGPRCPNISETKRDRHMVTRKRESTLSTRGGRSDKSRSSSRAKHLSESHQRETCLVDSESVIRFAIGSTVVPFWMFPGWRFTRSDRNGPVGLVNVANGSVGTVTSRHHTRHRIVISHNGRYLLLVMVSCVKFFEFLLCA